MREYFKTFCIFPGLHQTAYADNKKKLPKTTKNTHMNEFNYHTKTRKKQHSLTRTLWHPGRVNFSARSPPSTGSTWETCRFQPVHKLPVRWRCPVWFCTRLKWPREMRTRPPSPARGRQLRSKNATRFGRFSDWGSLPGFGTVPASPRR